MKRRPNCTCAICNTPIYRRPTQINSGNVYCSQRCVGKSQQKQKVCNVCGHMYVGQKRTCSRACANTSRTGISYNGKSSHDKARKGTLLKRRLAKSRGGRCERCSENNYAILQVHHITERRNGGTNVVSNLELLCPNCHAVHHLGTSLYGEK